MDYNNKLATSFLILAGFSSGCHFVYNMIIGNVFQTIVLGIVAVALCVTPYIIGGKK